MASIYILVTETGDPWAPFGDDWAHLKFAKTTLGYSYITGNAIANGTSTDPNPKGVTNLSFATQMQLATINLNIQFSYDSSATQKTFMLMLTDIGTQKLDLIDLISEMLNDVHGAGISTMRFPEDAKKLFDIDIESLSITYSKAIEPAAPAETISVQQSGNATFLGVSVASIAIDCNKAAGAWGYGLQLQLPATTKPFARVLPIPGIEDFVVLNGAFGMFKGPANPPSSVATMVGPSGNGTSIYLTGSIQLDGNDFLGLVKTVVKTPQVEFAVQSGGNLSVKMPVGKLELTIRGHPMFSVSLFQLDISQGNFSLSAELDLLCEWLAPSIKEKPIGFRFNLGIAADGSLIISIYSVDRKTGQIYPDRSKDPFIVRPFYIPGLVLYPCHFSMRWLAEAEEPEALSAGGGFAIQGSQISNVYGQNHSWYFTWSGLTLFTVSPSPWTRRIPRAITSTLTSKKVGQEIQPFDYLQRLTDHS